MVGAREPSSLTRAQNRELGGSGRAGDERARSPGRVSSARATRLAGPRTPHLVRVQVGVRLAQTVQERFRVSAQRLPGGEEVGAADVESDPFGHAARALGQSAQPRAAAAAEVSPQPHSEAAWGGLQQLAVILRHDPNKPHHNSHPPEVSGL